MPITFLKVNLPDKVICAISFPTTLFSPIDSGNKKYCSKKFCNGTLVITKNIKNKTHADTKPYINKNKY